MRDDYRITCPLCGDSLIIRIDSIDCYSCDYSSPRTPVQEMVDSRNLSGPLFQPPTTRKPYPGEGA
jgi:hypothetical protein